MQTIQHSCHHQTLYSGLNTAVSKRSVFAFEANLLGIGHSTSNDFWRISQNEDQATEPRGRNKSPGEICYSPFATLIP